MMAHDHDRDGWRWSEIHVGKLYRPEIDFSFPIKQTERERKEKKVLFP